MPNLGHPEQVETLSFLPKCSKDRHLILGQIKNNRAGENFFILTIKPSRQEITFSDSIEIADQVEAIRQSMRCRAVHVHKKQKCRINTAYGEFLVMHAKRMNNNNKNKRKKGKDQSKNACKHNQYEPQQIKNHPKEVDIKTELMSLRQNPTTLYGSSP